MASSSAEIPISANGLSDASASEVRAQLNRIIAHDLFRDTTRMKRFLRYVVDETIAGNAARLKGYTIGLEVFDRPEDFDPQGDTIVRVQAGQLRRRLDLYYGGDGQDDPVRIIVPKGRYSPSFEFRTEAPDAKDGTKQALISLVPAPADVDLRPGLAVITFDDLTSSDKRDFFAEGLTAEIVSALVQFRHIRVVAVRPTVTSKTEIEDSATLGERHNVRFILSGNVRRSGDVFRINVNLIDATDSRVLFGAIYDRAYTADNLFELQENIASHVAASVAAPFGQVNRENRRRKDGRRTSIPAYEAVLRFYEMGLSPRPQTAEDMLAEIEALTEDAPEFSSGYAIRAMLHVYLVAQCIPQTDVRANLDKAQELAAKAARIDPLNALAYFAQFQALFHDGRLDEAEAMAQRALSLNPNDYLMLAYFAMTQAFRGEVELTRALMESASRLVGNPPAWFNAPLLNLDFRKGLYQKVADALPEFSPEESVAVRFLRLAALGQLGKIEEGRAILDQLSVGDTDRPWDGLNTFDSWQPDASLRDAAVEGWRRLGLDI